VWIRFSSQQGIKNRSLRLLTIEPGIGASGGPVVDITTGGVIAVHRGWDWLNPTVKTVKTNKAVVINHHGNDVDNFVAALSLMDGGTPARRAPVAWRGTLMWWDTRVTIVTWP
jgi:hypothetical protein